MAIGAAALFLRAIRLLSALPGRLIRFGFQLRLFKLLGGLLQRQAGRRAIHWLTGKLRQINFNIRSNDNQIGLRHLFWRDRIARADGAARFNLHPPAAFFRFGFDSLCGHKGMRHAGWAGGHGDNAFRAAGRSGRRGRRGVRRSVAFRLAEEQLRVGNGAVNITEVHLFTVQRAVSRQR